jgi:hypothetical protein
MPVIQHYQSLGKVAEVRGFSFFIYLDLLVLQIDSSPSVEEVHRKAKAVVEKILAK